MSEGDRPDARNIVILVSDGEANVAPDETIPEGVRLKNEGQAVVKVLAVGQTSFINFNVLESVASRPAGSNIFHAQSFNLLSNITDQLVNATCNGLSYSHSVRLSVSLYICLSVCLCARRAAAV